LLGIIAFSTSCFAYSKFSFRLSWAASLIACCGVYFAVALILDFVSVSLVPTFIGVVAFLVLIWRLMPSGSGGNVLREPPEWQIPARIIAGTTLVLLVTGSATILGPHLSGLLTPFPVYTTILGAFIRRFDGVDACALFLRGAVIGIFTNAVFCFLIASFIVQLGLLQAMGLALLATLIIHSFLFYLLRRGK